MEHYVDLLDPHLNEDLMAAIERDIELAMEEARMLAESEPVGHLEPWEI